MTSKSISAALAKAQDFLEFVNASPTRETFQINIVFSKTILLIK